MPLSVFELQDVNEPMDPMAAVPKIPFFKNSFLFILIFEDVNKLREYNDQRE